MRHPDRRIGVRRSLVNYRGYKIFWPKKMCIKNQENTRILHDSPPKNIKIPEFLWYLPEKFTKFPNFTRFLPEKCPNFT